MSDNRARQELRDWTRARGYWDRAAEFLELAVNTSDRDVQNRYVTIAQHYRPWRRQKNEAQSKKAPSDVHSAERALPPGRR